MNNIWKDSPGSRLGLLVEALKQAPAVRRMVDEADEVWRGATDPNTPTWKAALILLAGFEAAALLPVELPLLIVIRLTLVRAFLTARDHRQQQEELEARIDRMIAGSDPSDGDRPVLQ